MMDRQLLREAVRAGMLPLDYRRLKRRILNEAVRLAESPYAVDYRTPELYHVVPCIFEVKKIGDSWVCNCSRFSRLGFCEHSLAVELKEGEG